MNKRSSGLRNRFRTGRSSYSSLHKARVRDTYGQYHQGRQVTEDIIAGHRLSLHVGRNALIGA